MGVPVAGTVVFVLVLSAHGAPGSVVSLPLSSAFGLDLVATEVGRVFDDLDISHG